MQPNFYSRRHLLARLIVGALFALILLNGTGLRIANAQGPCEGSPKDCGVPDGYILIEGDILIPKDARPQPDGTFIRTNLWLNGRIPYEFDANVTAANQQRMLVAIADWERAANVDFISRTNESDYVHIQNATANNSPVGRQGGMQVLNIYNWTLEFVMAHELAHALGFWHEQSRTDRNSFIEIHTENIPDDKEHNFQMETGSGRYGTYDFDSVMHYDQCAFSSVSTCPNAPAPTAVGGRTIVVKAPYQAWQSKIGQLNHLSKWDQLIMSFLYAKTNWRFMDANYTGATQSGSFLQPYKQYLNAYNQTPSGGTLWILRSGTYTGISTLSKPMTINAPLGATLNR